MRLRLSWAALATVSTLALSALAACDGAPPAPPPREQVGEVQQADCEFGPNVPGIDVSYYQNTVDWPTVAGEGWRFAIARISHSTSFLDPQFAANWAGIQDAGMIRGAYQYFEPSEDPLEQAQIVIDAVGQLGPGDLPVTVDVESPDHSNPAHYREVLQTWLDAVEDGTGKKPMIYTGYYYWTDYVGSDAFGDYPLWLAGYTQPNCPLVPDGWDDWTFWQWTSTGTIPGITDPNGGPDPNVDRNYFRGVEEELLALVGSSGGAFAATLDGVDMPSTVLADETFGVTVTFTNSGTETWDSSTHLGTSVPRDRASEFAAPTWSAPNRPAVVSGTVPPGATYAFELELVAPSAPGAYVENFALVQEGVTWFADAGGPADDAVHLAIQVVEGGSGGTGGGPGDGGAAATDDDGDDDDGDAPSAAAGVGGEDGDTGGGAQASDADEGCAVRAPRQGGRGDAATLALAGMALAGAIGSLRRRAELRRAERRGRGGVT